MRQTDLFSAFIPQPARLAGGAEPWFRVASRLLPPDLVADDFNFRFKLTLGYLHGVMGILFGERVWDDTAVSGPPPVKVKAALRAARGPVPYGATWSSVADSLWAHPDSDVALYLDAMKYTLWNIIDDVQSVPDSTVVRRRLLAMAMRSTGISMIEEAFEGARQEETLRDFHMTLLSLSPDTRFPLLLRKHIGRAKDLIGHDEFASRAGVSVSSVRNWVRGSSVPTSNRYPAIDQALAIPPGTTRDAVQETVAVLPDWCALPVPPPRPTTVR